MDEGNVQDSTMDGRAAPSAWNGEGKCRICNDVLYVYDSKYVAADKSMICTAHRVRDWQNKGIDFKAYLYWTDG